MLAADLKPGFPCPVCGSTDHPHPFAGAVDHVDISPENLQTMAQDVENLRVKQEQSANESHAAKTEYETRKETFVEAVGRLRNRMQKSISEIQKDAGLSEMNEALKIWKNSIDISLKTLKTRALPGNSDRSCQKTYRRYGTVKQFPHILRVCIRKRSF